MATINAIAHRNELTPDDPDDYYLLHLVRATLSVDDIVQRMAKREIAVSNVDGATFVKNFLKECEDASAEGNNIVTTFFRSSIGLKGSVHSADLGRDLPPGQVRAYVNFTQGTGAVEALAYSRVHAFLQPAAAGPVIQNVCDPTSNEPNLLPYRGMALIQGMNLSLKGEDPSVGITFTPVNPQEGDIPVFIPASKVSPNTSGKLQFALPTEVTVGVWRVTVTTQSSSGGGVVKTPRSSEYVFDVTIY